MEIAVTGHQFEVTPSMKDHILAQIHRLERRLGKATRVVVFIKGEAKNGVAKSIQVAVHFAKKQKIVIEKFERRLESFGKVIVEAFDAISTKLERRAGERNKKHRNRMSKAALLAAA